MKKKSSKWSTHDEKLLKKLYHIESKERLLKLFKRNWGAIKTYAVRKLKLSRSKKIYIINRKIQSYNSIKTIIIKRKGTLLTKLNEFKGMKFRIKIKCVCGYTWEAKADHIRKGSWCPKCGKHGYKSEEICRNTFEYLFDEPFPKKRPKWLINPKTGYKLELDGYNKELGIAFEYQGEQHYITKDDRKTIFKEQANTIQQRDRIKKVLCSKNNIILITIKYFKKNCTDQECFDHILKYINKEIKIKAEKVKNANIFSLFNINYPNKIIKAEKNAKENGFVFLGIKNKENVFIKIWKGNNKKYWYKCVLCKNISEKTADRMQQKRAGCIICAGRARRKNK